MVCINITLCADGNIFIDESIKTGVGDKMKKSMMFAAIVCMLMITACKTAVMGKDNTSGTGVVVAPKENASTAPGGQGNAPEMTQQLCEAARGHWNECSSPCLGLKKDVCAQVCVAQCECGGIAGFGCPEGYSCRLAGGIADELGACVKA
jgi:hypothetical protein